MKVLVVLFILIKVSGSTKTTTVYSTERNVSLYCDSSISVIDNVNVSCDDNTCPQVDCMSTLTEEINKNCQRNNSCTTVLPQCLSYPSNIYLLYTCIDTANYIEDFEGGEPIPDLKISQAADEELCSAKDHTTFSGQGHYLVVGHPEFTTGTEEWTITLNDEFKNTFACIRFWYNIIGSFIQDEIPIYLANGEENTIPLSNIKGKWLMDFNNIRFNGNERSLSFKRIKTNDGCIAIDDISLTTGECKEREVSQPIDSGQLRLQCLMVNIPHIRIELAPKNIYYDNKCQELVVLLQRQINDICQNFTFQHCLINPESLNINYQNNDCLQHEWFALKMQYTCKETPAMSTIQTSPGYPFTFSDLLSTMKYLSSTRTWPLTTTIKPVDVTTSKQLHETTELENDQMKLSSQNTAGNTGLIVGVVIGLLLTIVMVIVILVYLKRSNFFKTKKQYAEGQNGSAFMMSGTHDRQQNGKLEKRNSDDHVYNMISEHALQEQSDLDDAAYTSIDYEPAVANYNYKKVNSSPNKGLSLQAVSHQAYNVLDPLVTGFSRQEKNVKDDRKEKNDKKFGLDKCNNFDPQKPYPQGRVGDNYRNLDPQETGLDRSKPGTAQYCDLTDDYSVIDPSITGFDRTNKKEATTENDNNGNDYAELDPNETGFQNSVQVNEDKEGTGCYTILDPTETGFDRSNTMQNDGILNKNDVYELAKPLPTQSEYAICPKEGNYDILGSERETSMDEEHIYNHAPDSVYDTTSHVRAKDRDEETYDHFTGHT